MSGSGQSYSRHFSGRRLDGAMSRTQSTFEFEADDKDVKLRLRQNTDMYDLTLELDGGFISIRQFPSGSCMAMRIGDPKPVVIRGENFIDLITSHKVTFQKKFVTVFRQYGVTGLDPFQKDKVAAVLKAISGEETDDSPKSLSEVYVAPLLKSKPYLEELGKRQGPEVSKLIEKQLSSLR